MEMRVPLKKVYFRLEISTEVAVLYEKREYSEEIDILNK